MGPPIGPPARIVAPVTAAEPARVQATCCAALVDELVAHGVRHAVVAPGSRSTPVALALLARPELTVHVVHDERVAAFVALGLGLRGTPAVLLCTSGTAAANFHPAVVEAGLSDVPMIVLTADRPPELRDVGAPQSIDQTHLYGRSVRWFHDPGVPDPAAPPIWRSLGARAVAAAAGGPVHLNLPFREPLVGAPYPLPPRRRATIGAASSASVAVPEDAVEVLRRPRGIVLAGAGAGDAARDVIEPFVAATGWPLLADPVSMCRDAPGAIAAYDAMLRHPGFAATTPDVVVRVGRPATSKVLAQWVAASGAPVVQVGGPGLIDPEHLVAARLDAATLPALGEALVGVGDTAWADRWTAAAARAEAAIDRELGPEAPLSEPAVARLVAARRPTGSHLVVAASMPMRDLEWFGGRAASAHANRGANGIDGVVSTALGVALRTAEPTIALVGDIALVHDAGALTALARRGVDLRIVVVDNDGGGIFSFLPQATELPADVFELLFGTPHGTDVVALAAAHGVDAATVTTPGELVERLAAPGPTLTRVGTDRAENVRVHARLNAAVAAALDP
jgi:2-succinyl-5-enolpyruvyl-6-hydroxy-3-cyclohexene-1-carboxylate synthase